ncbi:MAG: hypothetical protein A2751_04355 [Candidatus Doudnabacteria bacterium RIFCSPHIGHO2_01_FULL_46_14]|uniref:POTRA domain-containing protein n=1 Tax=Candidatus Doudnabacteria bacterium RIFCSPHIGHO2_01_FULL_46_14 TaxID=1817824 RepID=A0A1F5NND6_9BACT|nr:MAG: hypothetical protein A2751_04355 [Candidatus Doudnabacteria bacterium RIFCSPHIGHO2_01_FULL_46_14]
MARENRFRKPEFQEKLAKARGYERDSRLRFRWKRAAVLALILAIVYFLTVSQRFLVKTAVVSEPGPSAEQIKDVLSRMQNEHLLYVIPKNHILVLNKSSLLSEIQQELPEVRSIKIFKKKWPNGLGLALEEREPIYVWQTGAKYFLLDQDGVVFQEIPTYTPEVFSQILIVDSTVAPVKNGERLPISSILGFIEQIRKDWTTSINQTNYSHFSIPGVKSQDIFARTAIGFNVIFDLEAGPKQQLESLSLILSREIRQETYTGLSYIDLRLSDKAYYCYKDAPCAPEYATSTNPSL